MKICRIIYAYSPYPFGGTDIHSEKISRALDGAGHESVIITINPEKGDTMAVEGRTKIYRFHPFNVSTIHRVGREAIVKQIIWTLLDFYSFYSYAKIRNILKKEKPDIVHLHTPVDMTLAAVNAVKSLKLPLVYTLHDCFLLCRRFILLHGSGEICTNQNVNPLCKLYRKFTKRIIDKVDIVIAPSQFVLDLHQKNGFFQHTKHIILPHGIELTSMTFENEIHLSHSDINILYVGGLTKHKGVHILIDTFKQITEESAKLHIVGDGAYGEELKRLAQGENRVIFHGRCSNIAVGKFYKMADVVVVPSICYDIRPNVIPEAFKAGVPVIGADIGGIPELVKDGHNGFLFKSGSTEQLKTILERVIKKPESMKELGKNACEFVKQFKMSKYIDKLTHIYKEAMEINRRRKLKVKV